MYSKNNYVTLIDPALMDNLSKIPSYNLGDLIINHAVTSIINELFPSTEIVRISAHQWIMEKERRIINDGIITFVGGSNILTSDIRRSTRLTPEKRRIRFLFPNFGNLVLLGAGWDKYSKSVSAYTIAYYHQILSKRFYQSTRDNYSKKKLNSLGINKVYNTSCPTMWNLDRELSNKYIPEYNKILFTLTDYDVNRTYDSALIKLILESGASEVYFFPQGMKDLEYLNSLELYKKNKEKIHILPYSFDAYKSFIMANSFNYIGTRLHGGIFALSHLKPALIIGIDNRALEIKQDTQLNVVNRTDISLIAQWISGEYTPSKINLPYEEIHKWKNQFVHK